MPRITDILHVTAGLPDDLALRLRGRQGRMGRELRRSWRRIRAIAAGRPIRVELATFFSSTQSEARCTADSVTGVETVRELGRGSASAAIALIPATKRRSSPDPCP